MAAAPGLHDRLRNATSAAHRRLEADLGLATPTVSRAHVVRLLERFHGFHAAWEPSLEGKVPDAIRLPRLKLPLLRDDLAGFGFDSDRLHSLPQCEEAPALCSSPAQAAGTLYVLEGATLGGRMIGRALQDASWLGGRTLRYWNPYGADTGRRWQETLGYLEALPAAAWAQAISSAIATFDLLHAWLLAPCASSEATTP